MIPSGAGTSVIEFAQVFRSGALLQSEVDSSAATAIAEEVLTVVSILGREKLMAL